MTLDLALLGGYATAFGAIFALMALITKWITAGVARDILELQRGNTDLEHRIKTIDREHSETVQRVVRIEVGLQSMKDTLDRVERTINDRFEDLKAHLPKAG